MLDLLSWQFGLLILATILASAVSTSVGFGFGITLVSLLQFFVQPVQIVGLGLIMSLANYLMRVIETRKIRTDGIAMRVTLFGMMGVPLGVTLLNYADPLFLKRFFSISILATTLLLMIKWRSPTRTQRDGRSARMVEVIAGTLGGFMSGVANLGGFAVVICSLIHDWEKMTAHTVFSRYFLATTVVAIAGLMICGLYDQTTVWTAMGLVPVVWAGHAVGLRLRARIPEQQFRRFLVVFLAILALAGFMNTLWLDT
jgi:uncharacterized membrane protein YfcA